MVHSTSVIEGRHSNGVIGRRVYYLYQCNTERGKPHSLIPSVEMWWSKYTCLEPTKRCAAARDPVSTLKKPLSLNAKRANAFYEPPGGTQSRKTQAYWKMLPQSQQT